MKARYYDPSLGRFVSEDPDFNGKNWFIYCDNNPVNNRDFTGMTIDPESAIVGAVLSLLVGWLGRRLLDRLDTWTQARVASFLQSYGQNKINSGEKQAAEGGAEVEIGDAMDDVGTPLMSEGKETLEGGLKEIIKDTQRKRWDRSYNISSLTKRKLQCIPHSLM